MVNKLIEDLVASLKEETVYKQYIKAKENLNQYADLLLNYKETKEEYIKMRPYFKYQDFTELKERFEILSNQVSQLKDYREYLKISHQLQNRLDELTDLLFSGVLIEAEEVVCASSQGNIKEEI